jgi:phosphate transport system permease protein
MATLGLGIHPRIRHELSSWLERLVEWAIRACGWSAIALVIAIFAFVFYEGAPALTGANLKEFFTSVNWRPDSVVRPQFGGLALLAGTASVTALAALIAVPAGFGAAIFISEFCGPRAREALKIVIEFLAAIPSVVWGFIGYMVLNPLIIWATDAPIGVNVLNGALILALMSVPIIVSVGEDALKAVPDSYREAAVALGANRVQLVAKVLLPAAKSGLLAAALLGIGRAVGETIAVLMVTGHAVAIPYSLFDPVRTLTATIAAELGETAHGSLHYRMLFAIGSLLVLISVLINIVADLAVKGVRRRPTT